MPTGLDAFFGLLGGPLLFMATMGFITIIVASPKGYRPLSMFLLGALVPVVGILIGLSLPDQTTPVARAKGRRRAKSSTSWYDSY